MEMSLTEHDAKTLEESLVELGVKIGFLTPEKAEQLLKEHSQIIRCKDCKFPRKLPFSLPGGETVECNGRYHTPEWFCADGKRKEGRKKEGLCLLK